MYSVQPCYDTSDSEILYKPYDLYLKPIARLHISVQLPPLKTNGKSISNWEIMEKVRSLAKPDEFSYMKVVKSTLEFVRFEAELESRHQIKGILSKLDQRTIKLSGFPDTLKTRACEAKCSFPSKHDWDSFFRDAKNMNEMRPGERPDTVHLSVLPSRWFTKSERSTSLPDEKMLLEVFESFGPVRCVDVPLLDHYRPRIFAALKQENKPFTFGQDANFEAFIQYQEYMGFVRCMTALKGMKLLYKEGDKAWTASIQVDFDKTKHLSESSIRKRQTIREKLIHEDLEKEREEKRKRELEEMKREEERRRLEEEKVREREEERRKQKEKKKKRKEMKRKKLEEKLERSIAMEERKLLITQRKLESLRLLDFLFEKVKVDVQKEDAKRKEEELVKELEKIQKKKNKKERKKAEKERREQMSLEEKEKELRSRLVKKYTKLEEKRMEEQREKLRQAVENSSARLKSVIASAAVVRPNDKTNPCSSATEDVTLSEDSEKERSSNRKRSINKSSRRERSRSRSRSPHRKRSRDRDDRNPWHRDDSASSRDSRSRRQPNRDNSYSDYYNMYDRYFSSLARKSSSTVDSGTNDKQKPSTSRENVGKVSS